MITTGIVRKIDGLGRIVLPKELRYSLNVEPGNDFEILVDNEDIVLRKYSKIKNNEVIITDILKIFNTNVKFKILLIVNNKILGLNEEVFSGIKSLIGERKIMKNVSNQKLSASYDLIQNNIIYPLVINSDLIGTIIAFGLENISVMESICGILHNLIWEKIVE